MTFIFPLFRGKDNGDKEDEVIRRIKRKIEVKWGLYCVLSLLLWIVLGTGIVVLICKTTSGGKVTASKGLATRWGYGRLWEIYH